MPSESERVADWINDVIQHIDRVREAVGNRSFDDFQANWQFQYAVRHALLIVSEASRRLPEPLRQRHPSVPWRAVADLRNFYTHEYQRINPLRVWHTATEMLDVLDAAMRVERNRLKP